MGILREVLAGICAASGRKALERSGVSQWHTNTEADCSVFSYKQDFSEIWGLDAGGLAKLAEQLVRRTKPYTLLVVWDGMPEDAVDVDGISVSKYVTPYDWGIALSLALYRYADVGKPRIRILIFDVSAHSGEQAFTQGLFFAFHNVFPWVQTYQPVAKDASIYVLSESGVELYARFRQAIPPSQQDAVCLIRDIKTPEYVLTTFADEENRLKQIEAVAEVWRQDFLKSGGRHEVANLVAPFILADGLSDNVKNDARTLIEKGALKRRALWCLLTEIGLIQPIPENDGKMAVPAANSQPLLPNDGGVFGQRKNISFLLVDDQCRLGYHHILGYTLFGDQYDPQQAEISNEVWSYKNSLASLQCVSNANNVFDALSGLGKVDDWGLPRSLDIPNADILIMDLRLWLEDETGARLQFMKRLTEVCIQLGAKAISDPHFQRAHSRVVGLAQGKEVNELPALAALPLLLSHIDRSIPIILFSSTHQREILEMVSHRQNIITTFAKPLMSGYGVEQRSSKVIAKLRSALSRGIDLHEARIVWKRFPDLDWGSRPQFKVRDGANSIAKYNSPRCPQQEPQIDDKRLRKLLADCYEYYLQGEAYYDFVSVPYEFIESAFTPPLVALNSPDTGFCLEDVYRNQPGRALQNMRNRKAHGHVGRPRSKSEQEYWRKATIFEFLVWLDFIEASKSTDISIPNELNINLQKCWDQLKVQHGNVLGADIVGRSDLPDPRSLSSVEGVAWLLYAIYATTYFLSKSFNANSRAAYFSTETRMAINGLQELLAS